MRATIGGRLVDCHRAKHICQSMHAVCLNSCYTTVLLTVYATMCFAADCSGLTVVDKGSWGWQYLYRLEVVVEQAS